MTDNSLNENNTNAHAEKSPRNHLSVGEVVESVNDSPGITNQAANDAINTDVISVNEERESDGSTETDDEVHDFTGDGIKSPYSTLDDRRMSKSDAISLVGGHSILQPPKNQHPIADPDKTAEQQDYKVAGFATDEPTDMLTYSTNQKTFSFSLPFGGFTKYHNLTHSLSKHLHFNTNGGDDEDPRFNDLKEQMELKLQRQQSINTLDETYYFKNVTKTDNARMRAVKSSLSFFKKHPVKEDEYYDSIYNEISGNILVLGGFRGSVLKETKTNKRVWVPFKAGMHLSKVNLLLGPSEQDELNASQYIYPSAILSHIGPIDICRKFIKKLKANPKTNVTEWAYDWRMCGDVISDQLVQVLQNIYKKTGKPTLVIGHSMGGLMAHGALQKAPHLFRGVIYVGSPTECCNVLGPIRYGDSVLLSDKILTFETNFMMRSAFNFLPLSGRIFTNLDTGEHYDIDYFDANTWVEYNLNPLVSKKRQLYAKRMEEQPLPQQFLKFLDSHSTFSTLTSLIKKSWKNSPLSPKSTSSSFFNEPETSTSMDESTSDYGEDYDYFLTFAEAYEYLSRELAKAKAFMTSLEWRPDLEKQYPPMAMVYGNKVPSVRGSNVRSEQDIKDGNYNEFYYGHGDGVVHQRWLMPERKNFQKYDENTGKGEIVGKFPSDCGHINLMTDFKAMGQALHAIHEAEKDWKSKKSQSN